MWFLELIINFLNITSDRMSVGALRMACGGFQFSLYRSLYLITLIFINFVFSMNLFRVVQFESFHWRSLCAIR